MKKLLFLFLFLPFISYSQGGTWPVKYGDSDPSGAPSAAGTRLYFNTATNTLFFWEPAPSSTWRKQPKAFDQVSGCAAPAYTPTARQSTFAVNACTPPEFYQYTGSAWECLNCVDGLNLTAGTGITLSGTAPDITISNSAPDITISLTEGDGIDITGLFPDFTVTNSAPNVVQTLSIAGQDLTLSGGGGTVEIPAGGNGIYGGSGSIPYETVASLLEEGTFRISFFDESPALQMDDLEGRIEFNSGNGGTSFYLANGGFGIGATSLFSFNNANAPNNLVYEDLGPGIGMSYAADYSTTIAANPRSIPDVGTVELVSGRIIRTAATLDFGSTAAHRSTDLTVTVTGASVGDAVAIGLASAPNADSCFTGWVSAANTVTVRFNHYGSGTIDPGSATYNIIVTKY